MNVFDFDGTLYSGDSTQDFWLYAIIQRPLCLRALPSQLSAAVLYAFGRIDRETFKERFYGFLKHIHDVDKLVANFWDINQSNLHRDVINRASEGDLVVSASPEFLLSEICARKHWKLIASKVDPQTGELLGPNCRGKEKVARIHEAGYAGKFKQGYSDSRSDAPLMELAQQAFLVKKESIVPFPPC